MKFSACVAIALLVFVPSSSFSEEEAPTIAVYDFAGKISEGGQEEPNLLTLDMSGGRPLTHFDLVRSLEAVITDDSVKGVVLDVDQTSLGLAQLQEIRRLLLKVREAEKEVHLYTLSLNLKTALLGSAATHFALMPEGNVMLTGLYGESLYFKGMLDKMGIEVDVVHIGDYKSAGETLSRTGPSEAAKAQQNKLFDSIYEQVIGQIAEGRGIEESTLRSFIDAGFRTPEQAVEINLVDELLYRTDFVTQIRDAYGDGARFNKSYGLPDTGPPDIDSVFDLFALIFNAGKNKKHQEDYLAVVVLDAAITNASIAPVRTEILKAAKEEHCKGLVLRVNSPGGSALASDALWEATDEFKATKRPFVVSMGGVAASGGYYISAGADHIFAEEGTITGSIGVVGMKPALGGAMEKLGLNVYEYKRGSHADLLNTNRTFSEEEKSLIRQSMLDIYGTFKERVTDGRGDRIKGDLESHAGGRVFSGRDALAIGLVDQIGGLGEAISFTAKLSDLQDPKVYLTPEPKDPFAGLFVDPKKDKGDEFISLTEGRSVMPGWRELLTASPAVALLGPEKKNALLNALITLNTAQNEHVLLLSPAYPSLLPASR